MRSTLFVRLAASILAVVLPGSSLLAAARTGASEPTHTGSRAWLVEQNVGQTGAELGFVVRRPGLALGTTGTGYTVAIGSGAKGATARLAVTHDGARAVEPAGVDRLEATTNYLVGADDDAWQHGVATYETVRSESIYPGVSVAYSGSGSSWTSRYEIAAGADARRIQIAYDGATGVELEGSTVRMMVGGNLVFQTAPYATQVVDGETRQVAAAFTIDGEGTVGVDLGDDVDATEPVTVETGLELGAAGEQAANVLAALPLTEANAITLDANGFIYVGGVTTSLNALTTDGAYDTTANGSGTDIYVLKLASDGVTVVWATYVGGSSSEYCDGITIGPDGGIYLAGYTYSTNFPTHEDAFDRTFNSTNPNHSDAAAVKLSADGSQLVYGTYIGGMFPDSFRRVKVDAAGNAYFVGTTSSSDFPTTGDAWDRTLSVTDAAIVKLNSIGSRLEYSTVLGGSGNDQGFGLALAGDGSVYVTGIASSASFPTTPGAYDTEYTGNIEAYDSYVTRIDPNGAALMYSTFIGGTMIEQANDIAIDPQGNVVVAGVTSGDFPVTPGAYQTTYGGSSADAFVCKLDSTCSTLIFATYLGGSIVDRAGALALDTAGNIYISGRTTSPNFPVTAGAADTTLGDASGDIVVAKFTPAGALVYSTYFGGDASDNSLAIAVDANGVAHVGGYTSSSDLQASPGSPAIRYGFENGVVARVAPDGTSFLSVTLLGERALKPETAGIYDQSTGALFLRNSNSAGDAHFVFNYGPGGSSFKMLMGDWNGDGVRTPGLYDTATGAFFLKNSNGSGNADIVFTFGAGGANTIPLAGDWNKDGIDTIGLYDTTSGFFFLKNANSPGAANLTFSFGPIGPNVIPVVGDWNNDETDSIGVYITDTGAWFLRNTNSTGVANVSFIYGAGGAGLTPLVGDWDGSGSTTVGLYDATTGGFLLRNSNSPGTANIAFTYGAPGYTPLAGRWQ